MSKPSQPAAPDYEAAAKQTAAGNLEAEKYRTVANRVNQYTPYGSTTYSSTPNTQTNTAGYEAAMAAYQASLKSGQHPEVAAPNIKDYQTTQDVWSMNQNLSDGQQKLFDQNQAINEQLGGVAQQGVGYVKDAMGNPLKQNIGVQGRVANNSGLLNTQANDPNLLQQQVTDALYGQQTRYLDPQFQQSESDMENRLSNQGITRGSEAWNREMNNSNMQKEQAYGQARNSAIGQGVGAAQGLYGQQLAGLQFENQALGQQFGQGVTSANFVNQASAQQLAQDQTVRNDPVNMLNAVRTGQQMQVANLPQQQNVAQMGQVAGADYLGAAQAQGQYAQGMYNAQSAANSAMWGGAMGMAGMYAGRPPAK